MDIQNLTGETLGRFNLGELIGKGGMAAVYRAYQTTLKRDVAVKVIASDLALQPDYQERFTREAETSAALEHPRTVGGLRDRQTRGGKQSADGGGSRDRDHDVYGS